MDERYQRPYRVVMWPAYVSGAIAAVSGSFSVYWFAFHVF